MNLLEGGKGGEGRMGERGWGRDGGRVGREGGEGTWGRKGGSRRSTCRGHTSPHPHILTNKVLELVSKLVVHSSIKYYNVLG